MAWISYTGGDLAAFEAAYPEAVVVVSENDVARAALDFDDRTCRINVRAIEHQKVTEYRALTLDTAERLKAGVAAFGKKRLELSYMDSSYGEHSASCPHLIGTERTAAISRANEVDGYTLTVTESTTAWSGAVSGEYVEYSFTGAGSATMGDVSVSWGHSA